MAVRKHDFSFEKSARYYQLGEFGSATSAVWLVFHGYGHRAEEFITKFQPIADEHTVIIAPEGMYRFYLRGTNGKVGASWMTSDDREKDIADIVRYIDGVVRQMSESGFRQSHRFAVLGFSQGGPAAFRWASHYPGRVDQLIAWGSDVPEDVYRDASARNRINEMNVKIVLGDKDEFISDDRMDDHIIELHNAGVSYDFHTYPGNHDIDEQTLRYFHSRLLHDGSEW